MRELAERVPDPSMDVDDRERPTAANDGRLYGPAHGDALIHEPMNPTHRRPREYRTDDTSATSLAAEYTVDLKRAGPRPEPAPASARLQGETSDE